MWTNYHTHTHFCDGKESIKAVVHAAREKNLFGIGISSHAPLPFERPWSMKSNKLPSYLSEINEHKAGIPPVYRGLEIDFIPGKIGPVDFRTQLDYTIGSIHFVEYFDNAIGWEIDGTYALFLEGLEKIFHGNAQKAVERYFELTREMVRHSPPDLIGHLDKIKIQSRNGLFEEHSTWYQRAVVETLSVIEKSECIVEVNTRGVYQKKTTTPYPSPWILEQVLDRNIPITLSSDAHHSDDLTNQFEDTARILLKIGFKNLRILVDGRWQDVAFNEHGLQFKKISYHPMA